MGRAGIEPATLGLKGHFGLSLAVRRVVDMPRPAVFAFGNLPSSCIPCRRCVPHLCHELGPGGAPRYESSGEPGGVPPHDSCRTAAGSEGTASAFLSR
jgi:hypothetical protein